MSLIDQCSRADRSIQSCSNGLDRMYRSIQSRSSATTEWIGQSRDIFQLLAVSSTDLVAPLVDLMSRSIQNLLLRLLLITDWTVPSCAWPNDSVLLWLDFFTNRFIPDHLNAFPSLKPINTYKSISQQNISPNGCCYLIKKITNNGLKIIFLIIDMSVRACM